MRSLELTQSTNNPTPPFSCSLSGYQAVSQGRSIECSYRQTAFKTASNREQLNQGIGQNGRRILLRNRATSAIVRIFFFLSADILFGKADDYQPTSTRPPPRAYYQSTTRTSRTAHVIDVEGPERSLSPSPTRVVVVHEKRRRRQPEPIGCWAWFCASCCCCWVCCDCLNETCCPIREYD